MQRVLLWAPLLLCFHFQFVCSCTAFTNHDSAQGVVFVYFWAPPLPVRQWQAQTLSAKVANAAAMSSRVCASGGALGAEFTAKGSVHAGVTRAASSEDRVVSCWPSLSQCGVTRAVGAMVCTPVTGG